MVPGSQTIGSLIGVIVRKSLQRRSQPKADVSHRFKCLCRELFVQFCLRCVNLLVLRGGQPGRKPAIFLPQLWNRVCLLAKHRHFTAQPQQFSELLVGKWWSRQNDKIRQALVLGR